MSVSRRQFTHFLALAGSAAVAPLRLDWLQSPLQGDGEPFWARVRDEFVMPPDLAMFNAANLCPSSRRVIDTLTRHTREVDLDPSPANRAKLGPAREASRALIAAHLRVTPEEIVITRNTSEANNLVSSGLSLKAGDEVLIFADNHPSNHAAWRDKATRAGFTVRILEQPSPHPGPDYYVEAVTKAITPQTRLLSMTHVTSTVGDVLPVAEMCRVSRERNVLTLVDGAQSFGVLDVDLSRIQPDFYSGSAHKWPCGPRENGVLYVRQAVQERLSPTVISLYGGAVGVSRRLEANGQRDEAAMIAFGEAIALQKEVGPARIEARVRALSRALADGLRKIDGVKVWTSPESERSANIVSFQPAALDIRRLNTALYEKDRIVCATRGDTNRGGLRFSPHFYNSMKEIDRTIEAIGRYVKTGV
ncbi:MAG TPA: aminotransferase class V-fold PLP-dependent enzyme [Vicinamibacterales bacterium]|nr:aminotransferase class V-fold PLP-dependent enzyme [Vicinamibacterales bacterium]